jgi:transglutaminase-like putative cysteine protease
MQSVNNSVTLTTTLPVPPDRRFLDPTSTIDWDSPVVKEKSRELTDGLTDISERAAALFYFVRDSIRYNLFVPRDKAEHFKASRTLTNKEGYCVQKAVLLTALARANGIPAGLGFTRIRNNLMAEKALQMLGSNIMPFHGYSELFINNRWVKATPAWNIELYRKVGSNPIEFDGINDVMLPARNLEGKVHIEYLADLGHEDDVPLDRLWEALRHAYGEITLTR